MPSPRRHQGDTKTFEELTFAEQAKSINIHDVGLEHSIRAHLRRANRERRDVTQVGNKCKNQLRRLLGRL